LAALQKKLAQGVDAIFDGRDMGTVIFPHAEVKIFLTARPEVQAERRYKELLSKDPSYAQTLNYQKVYDDIRERDKRDEMRDIAPLKPAKDAHIIDTSDLSVEEVVHQIATLVKSYSSKSL